MYSISSRQNDIMHSSTMGGGLMQFVDPNFQSDIYSGIAELFMIIPEYKASPSQLHQLALQDGINM
jgi:hypothetical protein